MNTHILDKEVQAYIKAHRELSPSDIALKKSPFEHVSSSEIASQIDGWQRAVKKLPTWAFSTNIYYPDKINLEQCSSEHTALVKQTLIHKGAKVVDVTGGFSVDSCYIAQEAEIVVHCELNHKLSAIVKHNARELGVSNLIALATDGVEYVRNQPDDSLDYIYIDPSRRVNHAKVFLLEDCEPNIVELQDMFVQKSRYTIVKLSPLMDISTALQKLKNVKLVYVISLDGDCKELLFFQDREFIGEAKISAIRLAQHQIQEITFTVEEEKNALIKTSEPLKYLYDPDVAVTKAGAFKTTAKLFNLAKLHTHAHLYTSDLLELRFPGRIFEVVKVYNFNEFKKQNTIAKANVAAKNFPVKVDDIRKKFKLKDGGKDFLYFTTDPSGNHIVIHCLKVQ
ncbi:THUMP-like domain-containing protein [Sphingobacterium rhinopitheci]|uniref:THUMP-like domain-containing protein n=1 Tax=Sphingobacterium rhinopitheci TaxID=2781960 RepID=UPI001F51866E|nr:hypothetical protein [Sphingobacterium rhinopitheci]MCI0919938.1 hypothetical protein [Sphingobacterium rhinopitheci]